MKLDKKNWKCIVFGHKWECVVINKVGKFKFVGAYCRRCWFGHEELSQFIDKNTPIINSYSFEYWFK